MAALQASAISFQAPRAIASRVASQVPPIARTVGMASHSCMLAKVTPPVGIKRGPRCENGASMAESILVPPAAPAGKNFMVRSPVDRAAPTSDGVMTPGANGKLKAIDASTSCRSNPGARPKVAPASRAAQRCSRLSKVPAPTISSGRWLAMISIDWRAAAVRNVISAQWIPPSSKASANGKAEAASSMAITGMTPIPARLWNGLFNLFSWYR